MDLSERWVLVTGAGRRIGRAIALALADRGAHVIVHCHRSREEAETTAAQIRRLGRQAVVATADQCDWNAVDQVCREVWETTGGIDVLVNNAAIYRRTPLAEIREQDWNELLDTDLKGPFAFARFLGPRMRQRGGGKIINISDVGGECVWPGYIPYCIAKAGVVAMTSGLARALAPEVQVNALAPGTILWPDEFDAARKKRLTDELPLRRTGSPADVARAVCFLVESGDYITGTVLPIDGGRRLR